MVALAACCAATAGAALDVSSLESYGSYTLVLLRHGELLGTKSGRHWL